MFWVMTPETKPPSSRRASAACAGLCSMLRADERLGPALPDACRIAREHVDVAVDHRIEALPEPARRAEVRQAAGRRDARARERHHGRVGLEEARERASACSLVVVHASTVAPA